MTEYWKSYAKKYCDVCKCWITDNKASVQFHESGKRHKENVAKKINDLVKRATKEGKEKKELDEDMKRMEEAALEAYLKDVEDNPDHSAQYIREKSREDNLGESSSATESTEAEKLEVSFDHLEQREYVSSIASDRLWYEAKSDQGYSYYWNTQTNESVWEPPEGYVSVDEQNKEAERLEAYNKEMELRKDGNTANDRKRKIVNEETAKQRKEEVDAALMRERNKQIYSTQPDIQSDPEDEEENISGPQPRPDPYGAWTTVVRKEPVPVDLQLPPSYQPVVQPAAYTSVEPKVKIKEKTIDPSKLDTFDAPSNFKKRKIANRGNTRQRFDDDDE